MHRDASYAIPDTTCSDTDLLDAARMVWEEAVELGEAYGYRNAQATVLAPTGCLVEGSLVSTSRGLVRLGSLGDADGAQWQDLDVQVATDDGPRAATKFYVNGSEQVVSVQTSRGYRIQGTPTHRIKVVDADGNWVWKRMAEIGAGDRVPMMLNSLVGEPQAVALPPLGDLHWNAEHRTRVPRTMSAELAEFVGYFMGDGSLHAKGIRLCVTDGDDDVVDRLVELGRELFGLEAHLLPCDGYTEVSLHSVALTIWWEACGFAKHSPFEGHSGKGWSPHIPDAILHSNDREVYGGFLRGLFEADGNANHGYAYWSTTNEEFSRDVQTLMLALGFVTTRGMDGSRVKWGAPCHRDPSAQRCDRHALRGADRVHVGAQEPSAHRGRSPAGGASRPHPDRARAARRAGDRERRVAQDDAHVSGSPRRRIAPLGDDAPGARRERRAGAASRLLLRRGREH